MGRDSVGQGGATDGGPQRFRSPIEDEGRPSPKHSKEKGFLVNADV